MIYLNYPEYPAFILTLYEGVEFVYPWLLSYTPIPDICTFGFGWSTKRTVCVAAWPIAQQHLMQIQIIEIANITQNKTTPTIIQIKELIILT